MTEDRAISLNAVIKAVDKHTNDDGTLDDDISCILEDLPPVTSAEPKTGHWEWLTEDKYRCSNCNYETRVDECMNEPMYDFCPFCGAEMRGETT